MKIELVMVSFMEITISFKMADHHYEFVTKENCMTKG